MTQQQKDATQVAWWLSAAQQCVLSSAQSMAGHDPEWIEMARTRITTALTYLDQAARSE